MRIQSLFFVTNVLITYIHRKLFIPWYMRLLIMLYLLQDDAYRGENHMAITVVLQQTKE